VRVRTSSFATACAPSGRGSADSGEPIENEGWAADLAALEAADGPVDANRRALIVEVHDRAVDAVQVAWTGTVVDADAVADAELGESLGRVDRLQQIKAGTDRLGDRGEVRIEFASDDLIEQPVCRVAVRSSGRDESKRLGGARLCVHHVSIDCGPAVTSCSTGRRADIPSALVTPLL
jgi:hypothetical protein